MAGVVQMSVDAFWGQLQRLKDRCRAVQADLNIDKTTLTRLWSQTKTDPDPTRRAANQALLTPVIHNNSILRMRMVDVVAKFNAVVAAASGVLKKAGYTPPTLQVVPAVVLVPVVAVTLLGVAIAAVAVVELATRGQRNMTAAIAQVMTDPHLTAAERERLLAEAQHAADAAKPPDPFGDLSKVLVPALGLVALIVVAPSLLSMTRRPA